MLVLIASVSSESSAKHVHRRSLDSLHFLHTHKYGSRSRVRLNSRLLAHLHTCIMDFSLTVKAATLIFISGRGWAISFAKQGKAHSFFMSSTKIFEA